MNFLVVKTYKVWLVGLLGVLFFAGFSFSIALNFSNTSFTQDYQFLIVGKKDNVDSVLSKLQNQYIIASSTPFYYYFWYKKLRGNEIFPGKYKINKNMSTRDIIDLIYNGKQYTIKVVINKFRFWGDFIFYIQSLVPIDSTTFTNELIRLANIEEVDDDNYLFTYIIPDTYHFFWTSSSQEVARKLYKYYTRFWTEERREKASKHKMSINNIYILASLIEEETNYNPEKPLLASVLMNRLKRKMPLGSCPSIKYALKDFGLKRILYRHLKVKSPYNTYRNQGLPPGPICIPSKATINATLDASETKYLFFVADFKKINRHLFSNTYKEHKRKSRLYNKEFF